MPHLIWDKDLDEIQKLIDEIRARAKPIPADVDKKLARIEQVLKSVRGESIDQSELEEKSRPFTEKRSSFDRAFERSMGTSAPASRPADSSAPAYRPRGLEKVIIDVRSALKGRNRSLIASVPLIALGVVFLCAVGYWVGFDIASGGNIWNAFFGNRGPEGLGIGMKIIHYFVIGLALFGSGLILFIRGMLRPRTQ